MSWLCGRIPVTSDQAERIACVCHRDRRDALPVSMATTTSPLTLLWAGNDVDDGVIAGLNAKPRVNWATPREPSAL